VEVARFFLLGCTLGLLLLVAPGVDAFLAVGGDKQRGHDEHDSARGPAPATLARVVRDATEQFLDVNAAIAMGYLPYMGCVSGTQEGAMGVHYVKDSLVRDGQLDPEHPEALLYEMRNGKLFLLGVEYIVNAAVWDEHNPLPPTLLGQVFTYNTSPNRFGLDPFYALHVWAWRDNPNGTYVDWNPQVSCDEFRSSE